MPDPITDQTVYLLEIDAATFVPLDALYNELYLEGLMAWTDVYLYEDLLRTDERFEVLGGLDELLFGEEIKTWSELNVLDFLSGPWVRLRKRPISSELVLHDLLLYLQDMNETLEVTWQYLPPGPDAAEARRDLLNMLMWGDLLERQIREALRRETSES